VTPGSGLVIGFGERTTCMWPWHLKTLGVRNIVHSTQGRSLNFMFIAPCVVLCNINQQNAPFLNILMLYFLSATCFEPEGSSSGRRLYTQYGIVCSTCITISSLVGRRVTAYTDACKAPYTVPTYTTAFLKMKMNPRVRNM